MNDWKTLGRVSSQRLPLYQQDETNTKNDKTAVVMPRPRLSLILEENSAMPRPNGFQVLIFQFFLIIFLPSPHMKCYLEQVMEKIEF